MDLANDSGPHRRINGFGLSIKRNGQSSSKKSQLKPWQNIQWCIGKINGDYISHMEDVLEVYNQAPIEGVARVCFDERPCQLLEDVYVPIPMKAQKAKKIDHNYVRKGTCSLMLAYDLDRGERYVQVKKQRRKSDYADFMDWLQKTHYNEADKICLVQDNLNTHSYASFYENLPLERASELRRKYEFHFTPKNGSWLNMAEIEFSSAVRQCIRKRTKSMERLEADIKLWEADRNQKKIKISWSFTVPKARDKMKCQYIKLCDNN